MTKKQWQFNPSGVIVCGNEGVLAFRQTGPAEHYRGGRQFDPNPVVGRSWGPTTYARLMIGLRVGRSFAKRTKQRLGFPLSIQEIKDQLAAFNRDSDKIFGYTLIPQVGSYTPIKYKGVPASKIPRKELLKFTEPSAQLLLYPEGKEEKNLQLFFERVNLIGSMLIRTLDQEQIIVEMVAEGHMICTGAWSTEDGDVKMGPRSRIDFAKEAKKAGLKV